MSDISIIPAVSLHRQLTNNKNCHSSSRPPPPPLPSHSYKGTQSQATTVYHSRFPKQTPNSRSLLCRSTSTSTTPAFPYRHPTAGHCSTGLPLPLQLFPTDTQQQVTALQVYLYHSSLYLCHSSFSLQTPNSRSLLYRSTSTTPAFPYRHPTAGHCSTGLPLPLQLFPTDTQQQVTALQVYLYHSSFSLQTPNSSSQLYRSSSTSITLPLPQRYPTTSHCSTGLTPLPLKLSPTGTQR